MASEEVSKNAKLSDEQEVTSQQRDQLGGGSEGDGAEQAGSLVRQSSVLWLTLEELQSSLCEPGRSVGSMNMDEFMNNIWNAEEFQAATGGCAAAAGEAAAMNSVGVGGGDAGESGLRRQGSFSLPPPLCRKTVDEVWADINQLEQPAHPLASPRPLVLPQPQPGSGGVAAGGRQATLGDMTLEDFLVKAGVVRGSLSGEAPMPVGLVHGPTNPMQQQQHHHLQGQPSPMMYPVAPANAMYPVMGDGMGFPGGYHGGIAVAPPPPPPPSQCTATEVSPGSSDGMSAMTQADMMNCIGNGLNGVMMDNGGGARKRAAPEDWSGEKSVERRHRRMIKNRESAARSRARKQAYTVELEAELNHLKEENARLKLEEMAILLARKQMLMKTMMDQSRQNVNAETGVRSRRSWSCMW